jgi:hypothetical protein
MMAEDLNAASREGLMRAQAAWIIGIPLLAGLVFAGAPAPARAQGYFGVAAGLYQPEDNDADRTEVFGIRGGYRFHSNFGFEGSLSRVDLADAFSVDVPPLPGVDFDFQADLYNLDLSLQWFPRWFPGRSNFVLFAGPGIARLDTEVSVRFFGQTASESDQSNIFTAHAGLAYEWEINDRFFVRPEARVRRYFDDAAGEATPEDSLVVSYKATDYEAGVTFGWRVW